MPEPIDRQAALEIAMCYCPDDDGSCSKAGHDIREMLDEIEALPTIEPEVRHGRWIAHDVIENMKCSECGEEYRMPFDFNANVYPYNFCPNCGADMEMEVGEDERH